MKRGLLLFAHGARDPNWALPFEAIAKQVRAADPDVAVAMAYLEFMSPGLIEAGTALVAAGCDRVEVLPLFLGAGGHVRKDLPALLDQLRHLHPTVPWTLRRAVGEDEAVMAAMAAWALRSAAGS
jgi:sirohydrochlorin cobaltochelatase